MNTPTTLPKLRHPIIVQSASAFFSPAVDYEAPDYYIACRDSLKGLQWGYQDPTPSHAKLGRRYMIYDEMGHHVLSEASTQVEAAEEAYRRLTCIVRRSNLARPGWLQRRAARLTQAPYGRAYDTTVSNKICRGHGLD